MEEKSNHSTCFLDAVANVPLVGATSSVLADLAEVAMKTTMSTSAVGLVGGGTLLPPHLEVDAADVELQLPQQDDAAASVSDEAMETIKGGDLVAVETATRVVVASLGSFVDSRIKIHRHWTSSTNCGSAFACWSAIRTHALDDKLVEPVPTAVGSPALVVTISAVRLHRCHYLAKVAEVRDPLAAESVMTSTTVISALAT